MMHVEFEFDNNKIESIGHTIKDVHYTIKQVFKEYGLPCIADGQILAFGGRGSKDDYSNLWTVILDLTESDWFLEVATACYWCEGGKRVEDILAQASTN